MQNILPITVIVAVVLFIAREVLDAYKKNRSNKRQKVAIKRIISIEIEKNNFFLKRVMSIIKEMRTACLKGHTIKITHDSNENPRINFEENEEQYSSMPIPRVTDNAINQSIMNIALVDKDLFEDALCALDALAELKHIRDSIIETVSMSAISGTNFIDGFTEYAEEELDDAKESLEKLYKHCTGKELEITRVR